MYNKELVEACRTLLKLLEEAGIFLVSETGQVYINYEETEEEHKRAVDRARKERKRKELINKAKNPTIDEVREYVKKSGAPVDPDRFWHYYESLHWMSGNTRITNWKSKLATWASRERKKAEAASFNVDEFYEKAVRKTYEK